jgi:hypothetical protein
VIVIEPTWSWPKTTMPIYLGEDMPQQLGLLHLPFSRSERPPRSLFTSVSQGCEPSSSDLNGD